MWTLLTLGQVLGLRYSRLQGMADAGNFLYDLIGAWLHRMDGVMNTCPPTWSNLVQALRDKTIRQNGIASKIDREQFE